MFRVLVLTTVLFALPLGAPGDGPPWRLVQERNAGPGTVYLHYVDDETPLSIHVARVDFGSPYIEIETVAGRDNLRERERTSSIAERLSRPGRVAIVGTNADFGGARSSPWGMHVRNGQLLVTPARRSALAIDDENRPFIALFEFSLRLEPNDDACATLPVDHLNRWWSYDSAALFTEEWLESKRPEEGTVFEVFLEPERAAISPNSRIPATVLSAEESRGGTPIPEGAWALHLPGDGGAFASCLQPGTEWTLHVETQPADRELVTVASGVPRIVRNGRIEINEAEAYNKGSFATSRHPRTAFGIAEDGRTLILAVVDGRQAGLSAGATLEELAEIMLRLGAHDALNMDGGGSSTMLVRGEVMNSPSDGVERETTSSLIVFSTAPEGSAAHLDVLLPPSPLPVGVGLPLRIQATDAYWNPVEVAADDLVWTLPEGADGTESAVRFTEPGSFVLRAEYGQAMTSTAVEVVAVETLRIEPERLLLAPGAEVALTVIARTEEGEEFTVPDALLAMEVHGGVAEVSGPGSIRALSVGSGEVEVSLGEHSAQAEVTVREHRIVSLDAAEGTEPWTARFHEVHEDETRFDVIEGAFGTVATLQYGFAAGAISAVYLETDRALPKGAAELHLDFVHEGSANQLRAILEDANAHRFIVTLASQLGDFPRMARASADLTALMPHWGNPEAAPEGPFRLREVYVVENRLASSGERNEGRLAIHAVKAGGFFDAEEKP